MLKHGEEMPEFDNECTWCGGEFWRLDGVRDGKNRPFCSDTCLKEYHDQKNAPKLRTVAALKNHSYDDRGTPAARRYNRDSLMGRAPYTRFEEYKDED